ncbi:MULTISPECIES: trans-sulfuration enzyme family protein [Microvirga]|uniref:trans-sulfuration enzyme family protein n=1 Tax=Microvirga TaxID=186650 RepID=UPI000E0D9187|nr:MULTISPECIES: PLP-dependent aspartate aminotransferase family protein [Microvirga]MBQ0819396.1 PLP-dependent transferase [Microvirga sp. HBU67558]
MSGSKQSDGLNGHVGGFATRAIHHGYDPSRFEGAVAPPVFFTSTYGFESMEAMDAAASLGGKLYAREHNPTTEILEARLANLEGAEAALALSTGMAAAGTLMLGLLSQDDEIIVHRTLYSNTAALTRDGIPRFGIKVVPVDLTNPASLDAALTEKTKLVYFETPVNPLSEILDIAAIAAGASKVGAKVVVDSTFASPALQRPLEHGAHIVLHSLTKYINGHGDVLGGVLLSDQETISHLHSHGLRYLTGATLSPMAAALILRGLKTLPLRMERHSQSALTIARKLAEHRAVAWVNYPFLEGTVGYQIAKKQMSGGSGMLAFGLKKGFEGARRVLDRLKLANRGVSLGDVETLINHPASILRARQTVRPEAKPIEGVGEDLIRLSIGLEDEADIWGDLAQALDAA